MLKKHAIWIIPLVMSVIAIAFIGTGDASVERQELKGATLGVRLTSATRGRMEVQQVSSHARQYGLRVGDQIVEVERKPIRSLADFVNAAAGIESGDKLQVVLKREGRQISLTRNFKGPIGVTRLETAATQGIQLADSSKKTKSKGRIDRKKTVAYARFPKKKKPVALANANSKRSVTKPPQFVPELAEFDL